MGTSARAASCGDDQSPRVFGYDIGLWPPYDPHTLLRFSSRRFPFIPRFGIPPYPYSQSSCYARFCLESLLGVVESVSASINVNWIYAVDKSDGIDYVIGELD